MNAKILVVDDEADFCTLVKNVLESQGHKVNAVLSAKELKTVLDGTDEPDIVLLDLRLPDADGMELLPPIRRRWPDSEVIVLTGFASFDAAVTATKLGAYDFREKSFDPKALIHSVNQAIEHQSLKRETGQLRKALATLSGGSTAIFHSASMKQVLKTVERVAPSDVSILIQGESGTGKEVIADLLHTLSPRAKGPLIKINCAALPRELIESELFGSMKGAFTGASADREGLFKQADGGTLMLDEISEMPVDTQSKLLRVLQEKEVRPVGGRASYKTNCRVIAATNRKIDEAIKEGKLREDLYYRISTITVALPPLRERREDIMPLAEAFLKRYAAQAGRTVSGFSPEARQRLLRFDWPGNVRQLQNEVQRCALMADGALVQEGDLDIGMEAPAGGDWDANYTLMEAMERNTILKVLQETGGNKLETAKRLGIGRQTLYNKIKAYGIHV